MLQIVMASLQKPFNRILEQSGSDMEPEPSECEPLPPNFESGKALFRLFVGWVPKLFTEQDLLPLFQQFGDVRDAIILKDRVTQQPRGCAFVSYGTKEEADAAIAALDKGVHLPGALCPIEVRYARSHQYVQAGAGPDDNRQLFFARAPPQVTEDQLKALFGQYGQVEEVNLFRERRTHTSKGCGFITLETREQAVAAMDALDEKHQFEGTAIPLAVQWADPLLQIKKRRAAEDSNAENRMLFFAKVLRSANEDEVRALFSQYGRVIEVNLFRAFQGAPTSKGCGLVTMGSNDEAAAAIESLDNKHVWHGMEAPMVVKWMDAALQKRRREEHLAAMRQGLVPSMANDLWMGSGACAPAAPQQGAGASLSQGKLLDAAAAAAATAGIGEGTSGSNALLYAELLPAGCAPDAYKLFVGNVPKSVTEEELRPVFEAIGPVVELVVVRDKFSHESKGSAFVWYVNKADADQAVLKFNMQRVLQDPTGEQDRPLVVRRANMRRPAASLMGATGLQAPPVGLSTPSGMSSASTGGQLSVNSRAMSTLDVMQQQGNMRQLGLGSPDAAFTIPPGIAMQAPAQQQQMQQQLGQPIAVVHQPTGSVQQVMFPAHMSMHPQQLSMQQAPVASASDNSASGSFMVNTYVPSAQHVAYGPQQAMLPSMQQVQQQPTYIVGHQGMPAMLVQQQSAGPMAGLHPQAMAPAGTLSQHQQLGSSSQASSLGPMVNLSLQVTDGQLVAIQSQLFSISAMSGAELATAPVAAGLFHIIITGAQAQVGAARQLITSLLGQAL